jgi:hypothetical protein
MFNAGNTNFRSSEYLVHELIQRNEYLHEKMRSEEENIQRSKDEIKFYIENLKALDDNVEVRKDELTHDTVGLFTHYWFIIEIKCKNSCSEGYCNP